jgi:S1-C subfamily serine protease
MSSIRGDGSRRSLGEILWAYVLLLIIVLVLVWKFWPRTDGALNPDAQERAITPRGNLAEDEQSTIAIFKKAKNSVVHITSISLRRDYLSFDVLRVPKGTGSGIVWDSDGHIVTNLHVLSGAQSAQVLLADRSYYEAERAFVDRERDLAVLWIKAPKDRLHPIDLGESSNLQVGQKTFAIGNPFGLDHTLTHGIVSALGREIQAESGAVIKGAIQTDAPINPGNSGGPLLDSAGRLIGVNTAILSPSGSSAGIGFAIPVDEVRRVVTQLIRRGKVERKRPSLGIQVAQDQQARNLGVPGVLIVKVQPGGPAATAGLHDASRDERGRLHVDAIIAIDGKEVGSLSDLYAILDEHAVGDVVTLTVWRNGDEFQTKATLGPAQ